MPDTVTPVGIRVLPDGTVEGTRVPPATVFHRASNNVPDGYLACNGQLEDPAQYPDLFAEIGTLYGGDGINTFGIPPINNQNRFIRGDLTPGPSGGDDDHEHEIIDGLTDTPGGVGEPVQVQIWDGTPGNLILASGSTHFHGVDNPNPALNATTDTKQNVPRYVELFAIIKT